MKGTGFGCYCACGSIGRQSSGRELARGEREDGDDDDDDDDEDGEVGRGATGTTPLGFLFSFYFLFFWGGGSVGSQKNKIN